MIAIHTQLGFIESKNQFQQGISRLAFLGARRLRYARRLAYPASIGAVSPAPTFHNPYRCCERSEAIHASGERMAIR